MRQEASRAVEHIVRCTRTPARRDPPAGMMAFVNPVVVQRSRDIPVSPSAAFAATIPIDLTALFCRWFGPIPPIREVRDQTGEWTSAPQRRTVLLTGGGSMREELVSADAPRSFEYRLTDITGAMAPLVDHVDGRWRFDATGTGSTVVTWSWTLYPRSALVRPLVVALGWVWLGYARRGLEQLERLITPN